MIALLALIFPCYRSPELLRSRAPSARVSAAFARNLLTRLNRDLNGDANPEHFRYQARWQVHEQRIEMALISTRNQTVHLAGDAWFFRDGEAWITEYSVKYSPTAAAELAERAGWRIERRWHDPEDHLSMHLLQPAD